jgi:hypothetical protein
MSLFKVVIAIILITFPLSVAAQTLTLTEKSQTTDKLVSNPLRGKHGIELSIGLLSEISASSEVSAGNVTTKSEANGLMGSIAYNYWLENDVAINFLVGLLDVDATTTVDGSETSVEFSSVSPMLFGVKFQPFGQAVSDVLRPYVSVSVGPYFGFSSDVRTGVNAETESYTETALGSRLGAGADLALSKVFTLGVGLGYHLVDDFNKRIGAKKNFSSPDFSLSLGIVFGRGK